MKKISFMLCSLIVLLVQIPYLVSAWRFSRLDQWDWCFYLLAVPAVIWALRKEKIGKYDWTALFLLVPLLLLALTPSYHHINAAAVASSVVCIFAAVWLTGSWQFACRILPGIVILLLGTPSSSYAAALLLMIPVWAAWLVKFITAMLCLGWIYCNKRFNWQIQKGTLIFVVMCMISSFLLLHSREIYFEGKSFVPEFTVHAGDFWGRSIEPNANTKRFFATSTVKQYRYTKGNTDISVLAVKCGNDIHEIHPASHCLRTSRWEIHSEKTLYLQDDLAVTEIDARKGSAHILVWVWYSSDKFSTPGFLGFRRQFKPAGNYYTYQISVPIYKSVEASRNELKKLVQALRSKK